jgi:hypothetical protein
VLEMRTSLSIVALFAVAIISSCSRSGDFSTFIVSEVAKHGGHAVTNTAIPALEARWTVKSDTNGFQASVTGASFASIDAIMQHAFGPPKISIAANAIGQPHRVWGAPDIGVALQLVGRTGGAEISCVRGMRDIGEFQNLGGRQ